MADYVSLKNKVDELAERRWDLAAVEARVKKLSSEGIPRKQLNKDELQANKEQILNRVQLRAEEFNYTIKNCAQSTALTLMEEFGLGNMEIIKALTPFPGIGGTGRVCGGITGSLIAFGLFFGGKSPLDSEATNATILIAQKFIARFEEAMGYVHCSDIIEKVVLGHKINPGESEQAMKTFAEEKGFEKCGLPPGTGASLAAEIIIDNMK
jgi:C_GCAxxG_C_C family probable redox protein